MENLHQTPSAIAAQASQLADSISQAICKATQARLAELNITQTELASLIGVTQVRVAQILSSKRVSLEVLCKLVLALQLTLELDIVRNENETSIFS